MDTTRATIWTRPIRMPPAARRAARATTASWPRLWWLLPVPPLVWWAGMNQPVLMTGAAVNAVSDRTHTGWDICVRWASEGGAGPLVSAAFNLASLALAAGMAVALSSQAKRRPGSDRRAAVVLVALAINVLAPGLLLIATVFTMLASAAGMGVAGPQSGLAWLMLAPLAASGLLAMNVRARSHPARLVKGVGG